jgi:DNA polymerase I-like protein with 3'-5' exonuclease and polymerase domains
MKRAMCSVYQAGLLPLVQMHDELGFSFTERRQCELAVQLMIDAVKLRVPVVVDAEIGRTWGDAKHTLEDVGL